MRTKIIPFNAVMAMEIQKGNIKGKIVRRGEHKQVCEILEFYADYQDQSNEKFLIVKVPAHDFEKEQLWIYHQDGKAMHNSDYEEMWYDLVLEVPDEPQFGPFDKVLMRSPSSGYMCWYPHFYSRYIPDAKDKKPHVALDGFGYEQCIPYEGNEHLVGTTDNPKEE